VTRVGRTARRTFASLSVRNYRLFFVGQTISLVGTWMQGVAQSWLVLVLTHSGVDLGIVTALQFLPVLLLGPWGGVLVDRIEKRRTLVFTQAASGLTSLTLGILVLTGAVELWMVYVLAIVYGLVRVIDMPTRQVFVMEMVGRDRVTNAVSLNGVLVNTSRIIGPAAAGILIATIGLWLCFLIDAVSYVAVIVSLLMMRTAELEPSPRAERKKGQLREGLAYAWNDRDLRVPLLLMAVVGTIAYNFSVLLPLMVTRVFDAGAGAYGGLFSVMGLGAVGGGLAIAAMNRSNRLLLTVTALGVGAFEAVAAFAPNLWGEALLMLPLGFASTAFIATSNSILQLGSVAEMRGRVMALFSLVFLGTTPIGSPIVGTLAQHLGPRFAMALAGGVTALVAGGMTIAAWRRRGRKDRAERTHRVEDRPLVTATVAAEPSG
jgi:MFS family permease